MHFVAARHPVAAMDGRVRSCVLASNMTRDHVELNCAGLTITSASIAHTRSDLVFRCTVNPVSDEVLGRLELAARSYGTIRLVFPQQPLLLERVQVNRVQPESALIVGRVVERAAGYSSRSP